MSSKIRILFLFCCVLLLTSILNAPANANEPPNQINWAALPDIDSLTSPAVLGHRDGRLYIVAVAHSGYIHYVSADAPGGWQNEWQLIGNGPCSGVCSSDRFATDTSPVLRQNGDSLILFARGIDNNLYKAEKYLGNNWSAWQQLTTDGRIQGRVSVAFTTVNNSLDTIHVAYTGLNNSAEYRRFAGNGSPVGWIETWSNAAEATIATDGSQEIWAAVRTGQTLLIQKKSAPWNVAWQAVTSRQAGGSQGQLRDISNLVHLGGVYHVTYTVKEPCAGTTTLYCHSLVHGRFQTAPPDAGHTQTILNYIPQDNQYPQAILSVYRNKLVMAYKDQAGWIRHARWDSADPLTPWIGNEIIDSSRRGNGRPALGLFNRREFGGLDYTQPNFGDDLFAVITEPGTDALQFINFSRAIFVKEIGDSFTMWNWGGTGSNYTWTSRYNQDNNILNPDRAVQVADMTSDGRPIYSEIGYALWSLPAWLTDDMGNIAGREGCLRGVQRYNSEPDYFGYGRLEPPCSTRLYPIVIKPDGQLGFGGGAIINRDSNYLGAWEELGHSLTWPLGLTNTSLEPTQALADEIGISLEALQAARQLFNEALGKPCKLGGRPQESSEMWQRCRGFTGISNNYDTDGREHAFIYVVYHYISDGARLRRWVREDLAAGQNLLYRKYSWVRENIFHGVEFQDVNSPFTTRSLVAQHSGKCLEVSYWSLNDAANVAQYSCFGGDNQLWELQPTDSGYYQIVARHSGKCLDVAGSSQANSANVTQYTCLGGNNQQWQLQPAGNGAYKVVAQHSGKCLEVAYWSQANSANVTQYACHGGANQLWKLQPPAVDYQVTAKHSGKCLEVAYWSQADSANVAQYTCHGGVNQQWELRPTNDGTYLVVVKHSGKCLEVAYWSQVNSANVTQYACHGGANQQWELQPTNDGTYLVVARHSGKCLEVAYWSQANSANVTQYACHGGDNQKWRFE